MSIKKLLSITLLLVLALQFSVPATLASVKADNQRLEVKASETEQLRVLLKNQKVNAILTDGTRVKGKVKEVQTGTLVVNVESSDGPSALRRGNQSVATESFSTLEIGSYKGKKRGILATALGAAGMTLGLLIVASEIDSLGGEGSINGAGAAVIAAATVGGAAAGYALGRNLDKKRLTIVIVK